MALRCTHCQKGRMTGHAVSHAKNRTKRLFLPNIQQLKVLKNGVESRVHLCTRCIKRMKNFGYIGVYTPLFAFAQVASPDDVVKKKQVLEETQSLDQLLAKQGITIQSDGKEKISRTKKKKSTEAIALDDIIGNK